MKQGKHALLADPGSQQEQQQQQQQGAQHTRAKQQPLYLSSHSEMPKLLKPCTSSSALA